MNAISATQLARAATLATEVEALNSKLGDAQGVVDSLKGQLDPLQKELDGIMGYKAFKAPGGTGRFTDEQRKKISDGLTASWAARKAKTAAAAAAAAAAGTPAANGSPAPANA